jgi:uncharacterized protein (DUF2141 family)
MKLFLILLLFFSTLCFSSSGDLTIVFNGLRNDKGMLLFALHDNPKTFLTEQSLTSNVISASIAEYTFKGIPFGDYAVAVIHDENSNYKLDTGLFGIPREGVGASNNKFGLGPPSFKDAVFGFKEEQKTITVDLRYLL